MSAGFPFLSFRFKLAVMPHIPDPEIIPPKLAEAFDALDALHNREREVLRHIQDIAKTMDAQFNIPGLPFPIGLDAIVGLIPGIGDTISLGVAGYIVVRAKQLGLHSGHLFKMTFNIFIDWLIGLVPIIGDIFDVGWRGNLRNAKIIENALEARWAKERADLSGR